MSDSVATLFWEGGGIARAAGGEEARDAVLDGRQNGEWSVRLGLIPIGDGEEIVGAVICVAVLDGGAERLGKRNGRIEMETIDGAAASGTFFAFDWCAEEPIGK